MAQGLGVPAFESAWVSAGMVQRGFSTLAACHVYPFVNIYHLSFFLGFWSLAVVVITTAGKVIGGFNEA